MLQLGSRLDVTAQLVELSEAQTIKIRTSAYLETQTLLKRQLGTPRGVRAKANMLSATYVRERVFKQ